MKTYLQIVIALVIAAGVYGLIVPFLVSAKETLTVLSGLALAILTPPCLCTILKGLKISEDKK